MDNEKSNAAAAAALASTAAAMAPRVRIRVIPGGQAVHTEKAAAKYNMSAVRKAKGLTLKITQAHAQLDHLKAKRNTKTRGFDNAAHLYAAEIAALQTLSADLEGDAARTKGDIQQLQEKLNFVQREAVKITLMRNHNTQAQAATQLLMKAAQQKTKESRAADQPKIDQLVKKRDNLIARLYHHQLLHPGCLPEKESTEDAKSTDASEDNEAIRSATPAGSDQG